MPSRSRYGWLSSEPTCVHSYLLPLVVAALPPGRLRIVDLGCGNGYTAGVLAAMGHQVTGIEPSVDGVAHARAAHPAVRFEEASVYDDLLPLIGGGYDVALATEVIEHLHRPRELFRAALSLLKPGGRLIFTTPYHGYFKNLVLAATAKMDAHYDVGWDGGHIKFFSVATLGGMAKEMGVKRIEFRFAGRVPLLWKSMALVGER